MTASFIGCKISLISKSEIRYEGILYTIDTKESTIALAKVRSFGTEDRVTEKPVAPRSVVYEYIIFRASDIKDLLVEDPPSSPGLSDPAIIQAQGGSSSGPASSATSFPSPTGYGASGSGSPSTVAGLIGSAAPGSRSSNVQPVSVQQSNRDHDRGNKSGQQQGLSSVMASGKAVGGNRSGTRPVSPGVVGSNRGKSPSRRDGSGNRDQQRQPRTFNEQRQQRGNQDHHDNNRSSQGNNRSMNQNRDTRQFRDDQRQFRDGDRRQTGFQDRRPRDLNNQDNRGGFRSNQRSDWPGQRPQRQSDDNRRDYQQRENRPPRTRPPMLDVRKLEEYDFEKANAEFVELTKDIEDLKISEDKKDGDAQDSKSETKGEAGDVVIETYNKTKSFFDTLSCEALERQKGNDSRVDRRQERKQNQETFGVSGVYNRNWRGRGGYRGGFNRNYAPRNYNNNRSEGGDRRTFNNHSNSNSTRGEKTERVN